MLVINDLEMNKQLDRKAMQALRGGDGAIRKLGKLAGRTWNSFVGIVW